VQTRVGVHHLLHKAQKKYSVLEQLQFLVCLLLFCRLHLDHVKSLVNVHCYESAHKRLHEQVHVLHKLKQLLEHFQHDIPEWTDILLRVVYHENVSRVF